MTMTNQSKWEEISAYILPSFYTALTHPLTHARVLMQLGYEPLPPYLGHSVLSSIGIGGKVYKYPSIFTYCKYLKDVVGIVGVFTIGLAPRIIYWNLSSTVSDLILIKLSPERRATEAQHINTEVDFKEFIVEIRNVTIARFGAVIICHPFHVLMIRQMAEILNGEGSEPKFMLSLILSIFDDEGIVGFYNGLPSKLIGEVSTIWLTAAFVYVFNKYVLKDRVAPDVKDYSSTLGGFLCSSLTYRFSVITTVMAISGSKIAGAIPFRSIFHCYSFLREKNAFNRGSSLFLRYV